MITLQFKCDLCGATTEEKRELPVASEIESALKPPEKWTRIHVSVEEVTLCRDVCGGCTHQIVTMSEVPF